MTTKPASIISYGLAGAGAMFLLDVMIRPQGLGANNGLSYYGDYKTTIIPYSLAFFASAYAYWEAARGFDGKEAMHRRLALAMKIMSALFIGLLVTPSSLVNPIHTAIGATLFSFQLLTAMWLVLNYRRSWLMWAMVAVMWLSGLGALYYLPGGHGLLLQTQVVFQLAFGLILINVLGRLGPD